jgi:hypothetical protein
MPTVVGYSAPATPKAVGLSVVTPMAVAYSAPATRITVAETNVATRMVVAHNVNVIAMIQDVAFNARATTTAAELTSVQQIVHVIQMVAVLTSVRQTAAATPKGAVHKSAELTAAAQKIAPVT